MYIAYRKDINWHIMGIKIFGKIYLGLPEVGVEKFNYLLWGSMLREENFKVFVDMAYMCYTCVFRWKFRKHNKQNLI